MHEALEALEKQAKILLQKLVSASAKESICTSSLQQFPSLLFILVILVFVNIVVVIAIIFRVTCCQWVSQYKEDTDA